MKTLLLTLLGVTLTSACGARSAGAAPAQADALPLQETAPLPAAQPQGSRDGGVVFDKMVHDFGDVSVADGPLSCRFTLQNKGSEDVVIFEVASSCGCTDVHWTRKPIPPGGSGIIEATYKNEDGDMPFDKTLSVYVTGAARPVILHLRGIVHAKKKSLAELYGASRLGDLGLKTLTPRSISVKQGLSATESIQVANLGSRPLSISFAGVSPGLSLAVEPNPIPAGSTATLSYSVSAQSGVYGRQEYQATPVVNGKSAGKSLRIRAVTEENFSSYTEKQRADAPLPVFRSSTVEMGKTGTSGKREVRFSCTNRGKSAFRVLGFYADSPAVTESAPFAEIPAGGTSELVFTVDCAQLPEGEFTLMLSLVTNAPLRPVVNLFVTGL